MSNSLDVLVILVTSRRGLLSAQMSDALGLITEVILVLRSIHNYKIQSDGSSTKNTDEIAHIAPRVTEPALAP